jgi:hypothetical protein
LICSFNLRYLPLVLRLQRGGTALCWQEALIQPVRPLREALIAYLFPRGTSIRTYVLDYRENDQRLLGFAQVRKGAGRPESEVIYIAPALVDGNGTYATWQRLLTHLCVVAGEQGQQRLYARTACDGEEQRLLQHVGFTPYTHENIYRLERIPAVAALPCAAADDERVSLRPQTVSDSWGVQRLYAAVSPRLVEQIEGSARGQWEIRRSLWGSQGKRKGYVVEEQGEIMACLQLRRGRQGSWLKILLHPQAYDWADSLLQQGLHLPGVWSKGPLYCSIRDYEGGVRATLDEFGFQLFARQAVMVKHTTVWAKEPLPRLLPALETRVEGAAPTVSNFWREGKRVNR